MAGNELVEVGKLIQSAIQTLETARKKTAVAPADDLPDWDVFNAQRTLVAAAGSLIELVSEPRNRLVEVASQYFESRALHTVVDARVADILHEAGRDGVRVEELARRVGIEQRKLSRLMRCLCSIHIFREVGTDVFANNSVSQSLVGNESLRAYILIFALDIYSSSDYLPRALHDSVKGPSYAVDQTAWQDAAGTPKSRWDWLEEETTVADIKAGRNGDAATKSPYPGVFGQELKQIENPSKPGEERLVRPELTIFSLAMMGGGRIFGRAHLYDFPWASLGSATVVDVGGGVGGFCLQLAQLYPELKFVLQDRLPNIEKAQKEVWPRENPKAIASGRIRFVDHDFFKTNPVQGAEVYWLRYILHDWSDDYCVRILSALKESMGPKSRILICDQVMNTTKGCQELLPAPAPLLANWGYFTRYSHHRDLTMMSVINGIERKPEEFKSIVSKTGLRLRKIWECRSQVGLVEIVLPDSEV